MIISDLTLAEFLVRRLEGILIDESNLQINCHTAPDLLKSYEERGGDPGDMEIFWIIVSPQSDWEDKILQYFHLQGFKRISYSIMALGFFATFEKADTGQHMIWALSLPGERKVTVQILSKPSHP